ncbi:DUF3209 family protein [Halobaculum magnesiiphilum]|uniref:DUF3209 family protein n=1 Tax=Halobaculum magnesiiphilum TaxID=1017351 RepID=A0A8T8WIP8_9EURY|nr:DUF3209 family protein [Halobaculum magnesiiphilum]QZP39604.1 DUF3209 family protein [Halobaculum magnesiiphilum]
MSCLELEALRLGLMTVLGTDDRAAREHAEKELEGELEGPIEGLATAETLDGLRRHLDAALVDLEEQVATLDDDDPEADYVRGRLVAVRDAERSLERLATHGEGLLDGLGETHHDLHDAFPVEE